MMAVKTAPMKIASIGLFMFCIASINGGQALSGPARVAHQLHAKKNQAKSHQDHAPLFGLAGFRHDVSEKANRDH